MKLTDNTKIKMWLAIMMLWGTLTGRTLPQWEDIANSPLWFADVLMYWVLILVGVFVIWKSHKIIKLHKT